MYGLGQELRYAARRLRRSPAFTLAAALTLALAIGANASIFAVVQRVVLNPLPYPDSDRLIELDHGSHGLNMPANLASPPDCICTTPSAPARSRARQSSAPTSSPSPDLLSKAPRRSKRSTS
jgi:hypothetical protein